MSNRYRGLPSVDLVLAQEPIRELVQEYSHDAVVRLIRQQIAERRATLSGDGGAPTMDAVVEAVTHMAQMSWHAWPRPVINATGVVLHTNLGRAPLSADAVAAMTVAARGYSDLELELESGERGSRQAYVASLLCQITGAEAALVVNNNASAVALGLAAIAQSKEVVVSRGEAVEIGGGFRIPDVLLQSGARLVEVGTTNRTYVSDYETAISEDAGALLKVHASNFRVVGFTHVPAISDLVVLGAKRGIPVLNDLGSGCLLETTEFGLAHEPTVQEGVAAGCDLLFFSGDKLLGGPQAGIVVGKKELVNRLERHPLARAVRIDKLGLAALTATLLHYLKDEATSTIPIWMMIASSGDELKRRAARWKRAIGSDASLVQGESAIGGGSLPGETLPTWLVALSAANTIGGAEALAARLRRSDPPVMARIQDDLVVLDPRTVLPEEERALVRVTKGAVG
jgi:L-seryl-tRNA(Ser) seleniumtransferase